MAWLKGRWIDEPRPLIVALFIAGGDIPGTCCAESICLTEAPQGTGSESGTMVGWRGGCGAESLSVAGWEECEALPWGPSS